MTNREVKQEISTPSGCAKMLTQKQENFCQNILKGMTQYDAFVNAYNTENMQRSTIDESACRLAAECKISARVKELRSLVTSKNVATPIQRKEILSEIAHSSHKEPVTARERTQAIDTLNKMDKLYSEGMIQDNRSVTIIVSSEKAKELTENVSRRLLGGQKGTDEVES